ncbi:hypothetical protein ACFV8X_17125 [Streptomyces sp. NPDC059868]|uniref:hypothetical protein n=1 Tax=Streptomyces sp. NPDC059868 TaxID=3346979 RepID=UPI003659C0B7
MEQTAGGDDGQSLLGDVISVSGAFDGSEEVAFAATWSRSFLTDAQAVPGLPVSGRATDMVQLVVSELVTNARKVRTRPLPAHPGDQRRRHRGDRLGQQPHPARDPRARPASVSTAWRSS